MVLRFGVFFAAVIASTAAAPEYQIHLSLTKKPTEMVATWITFTDDGSTLTYWQRNNAQKVVQATTTSFQNSAGSVRYSHRATMTDLTPGAEYFYHISGPSGVSTDYFFRQLSLTPPYRICMMGDLGIENGKSIPHLLEQAALRQFDLVIHVGDIAYDLYGENGTVGDQYFTMLEPLFATVPYMVIAGNHEEEYGRNYTAYKNSFTMPNEGFDDNQFYSFDLGPIHFVGLSTEFYGYYNVYGMDPVFRQYEWLQKDFEAFQKNRANTPWLIVYQHRPFYCSNSNSNQCNAFENRLVRVGFLNMPGLEPIFVENKVDLAFWGHEHSYERFYPRIEGSDTNSDPYNNAEAPTYVISGSAGCHSGYAYFGDPVPYSAARFNDYGYTLLTVANSTHIHHQQISVEKSGAVIDDVWYSKDTPKRGFQPMPTTIDVIVCHPKDMHCHRKRVLNM